MNWDWLWLILPFMLLGTVQTSGSPTLTEGGENDSGDSGESDNSSSDSANTGDANKPKPNTKTFTQDDVNRFVAEEKRKWKEKQDEADNEKKGEYKTLAEQRGTKIAELEPQVERASRLAERWNTHIDTVIKDWPAEVKLTDPGTDDVEARLKWLDTYAPLAEKLSGTQKPPAQDLGKRSSSNRSNRETDKKETYRFQRNNDVSW